MPDGEFELERWRGMIEQLVHEHEDDLRDLRADTLRLRDTLGDVSRGVEQLQSTLAATSATARGIAEQAEARRAQEVEDLKAALEDAIVSRRVTFSDLMKGLVMPFGIALFTTLIYLLSMHH